MSVTKDEVKAAPGIDPDGELSPEEEQALYSHYGRRLRLERDHRGRGHGRPRHQRPDHRRRDDPLRGGARPSASPSVESGRVRLRKYVVTEQVQQTVPVQREEVRVEREPITDANVDAATDGPAISDEEHEVVLHQEEVVTEKRRRRRSGSASTKDTVVEEAQVSDEVRKEQIEVEDGRSSGGAGEPTAVRPGAETRPGRAPPRTPPPSRRRP